MEEQQRTSGETHLISVCGSDGQLSGNAYQASEIQSVNTSVYRY
jgi:hypothetical protein